MNTFIPECGLDENGPLWYVVECNDQNETIFAYGPFHEFQEANAKACSLYLEQILQMLRPEGMNLCERHYRAILARRGDDETPLNQVIISCDLENKSHDLGDCEYY